MATLEDLLASELEADAQRIADRVAAQIRRELPQLFAGAGTAELARTGIEGLLREFASVLRLGTAPRIAAPHTAMAFAQALARSGVPLADVLRSYRIGQEVLFAHAAERAGTLGPPDQANALARVGALSFRFTDAVIADAVTAFEQQLERRISQTASQRENVVERLLAGDPVQHPDAALGYRTAGRHLALVGVGESDTGSIIRALSLAPALVTSRAAWIRAQPVDWQALGATGLRVAVGAPGAFIHTYRDAQRASRVAVFTEDSVTHYADVALLGLLLENEDEARRFAREELAGLTDEARLLVTLQTYFDAGQDRTATAARLGIHRNTVQRRLEHAEHKLGHPLHVRRRELEAAIAITSTINVPPRSSP